ncbi:choline dehydrogenase-like flavoprotein [Salinibacter ruber]|uniref:Choline dehydrogenase-like flavoprotein n=1 Tax=Salinibacter ruber TaxID=146919 RepID=A0A9X2PXA5_9BACT|nr:GMC family oxidoreductase [Salinibacter ruber]MCS3677238.1 choline dehydrogenase-like flavoprotein [Salinibacter ruber]MCS3680526.1 choline dehydrogenase-like flavoprotein [Salinibacter ruber]
MPFVQETPDTYDVCIVGSGAGGSMAAKVLAEAGANVVVLEAGPEWSVEEDGAMFDWNYSSPRRGASTTARPFGEMDACLGGWDIEGEPYTTAEDTNWNWFRARMLGGRTHHWGRISLRFGPDDFNGRSVDGHGQNWPIDYQDLKPYYDRVDRLIGLFGSEEGFYNAPDGIFMEPPEPRCYEKFIKSGAEDIGIPVIPSRLSILTEQHNGRAPCHYCAQCNRGCTTHSNFSAPPVLLDPALQTGNVTLITHAMAREVTTDQEGQATGVSYVDTQSRREQKVKADVVVLAASACESARLLLNSTSRQHPNGLANSSGAVGRYLMDSTGSTIMGVAPQLMDQPAHNCDGVGGMHSYIPWWAHDQDLDFPRGYHFELWGGRGMPGYGFGSGIQNLNAMFPGDEETKKKGGGGYGQQLKNDYRRFYGATVGMSGRGESIARRDNYCEIDPDARDEYGIPVLRFHHSWGEEEYLQVKHMQEKGREILRSAGAEPLGSVPSKEDGYGITMPGEIIHEAGVTRMGTDPDTSVLNAQCQAHDVDNLFVADAGPFTSMPHKNPTWTILALSMRTSEYIIDQRKKGNI